METATKNGGGPVPGLEAKGTESAEQISKSEHINACPECSMPLQFGSRDPLEGDYFWCPACGAGPVIFPLYGGPRNTGPRKPIPGLMDPETMNAASFLEGALKRYPVVQ